MGRLILVRHAHPVVQPAVPSREWRLSDEGRAAAVVLAERLRPHGVAAVVSSVEPKAWETAAILAQRLGVPCSAVAGLHEHERDGAPFLSAEQFQATMRDLFAQPCELIFGSETAAAAQSRFTAAVEAALAQHFGAVAIVAHGTVIALYRAATAGVDAYAVWRQLGMADFVIP